MHEFRQGSGLVADDLKLEIVKNHIKADPKNGYATSVPGRSTT